MWQFFTRLFGSRNQRLLKSYGRWDDYTVARDDMFVASDTSWAPWFVARSDDKKAARLNIIKHLLSHIPYEEEPRPKIKLPKRKIREAGKHPDYPFKLIPEAY